MTDLTIRPLVRQDLEAIKCLFAEAFREEYQQRGLDVVDQLTRWQSIYQLAKVLSWFPNPYQYVLNFFVAQQNGELAGFVLVTPGNRSHQRWHIDYIATAPRFRGRGIAQQLLNHVIEYYGVRGATTFTLEVDAQNLPALGLYGKTGFHRYATVYYYKLEASHLTQLSEVPAPAGLRAFHNSDSCDLFELHNSCTPAGVRLIDTKTPTDFHMGPSERLAVAMRHRLGHCEERRYTLRGPGGDMVAYMRLVAQLRPLPHSIQVLVHPAHELLLEPLMKHGLGILQRTRPGMVLSWAPDYQPGRKRVLEALGMQLITADHSLARTSHITFSPAPLTPSAKAEEQAFKPAYSVKQR